MIFLSLTHHSKVYQRKLPILSIENLHLQTALPESTHPFISALKLTFGLADERNRLRSASFAMSPTYLAPRIAISHLNTAILLTRSLAQSHPRSIHRLFLPSLNLHRNSHVTFRPRKKKTVSRRRKQGQHHLKYSPSPIPLPAEL
jgi:hypothetical protein